MSNRERDSHPGSYASAQAPPGQVEPPPAEPFDFIESKVRVPAVRPGSVSRIGLVNQLRAADSVSIAVVAAPAGYGKTTLLAQWAARDERPFAWVSVDDRDNDPVILLRHIAMAVHGIVPVDRSVLDALRSPGPTIWRVAVPRLASAVATLDQPFVMVLDQADLLVSKEALDAVSVLADQIPEGSMLVLAGRRPPRLGIARLRADGRLFEIGTDMLALSRREAQLLLRGAGVEISPAEVVELVRRTEGWAAGLHLAALSAQSGDRPSGGAMDIAGDDPLVAEYLRHEHLSRLTPETLTFLRRSSVLGRMSGSLCDAVLETEDSGLRLECMHQSNLFLVPLDRRGEWYRYHHLFEDLLRRELEQRDVERIPALNRRAADWFEANGELESALEPAADSGDMDRVARIFTSVALPTYHSGRVKAIEGWLDYFDDDAQLERYPPVAVLGAWIHALCGRRAVCERWLHAAESGSSHAGLRDDIGSTRPWIAVLRAALCRDGVDQMLLDAETALLELSSDSQWHAAALVLRGTALVLLGEDDHGDSVLAAATAAAARVGATDMQNIAVSERALVAAARGDHAGAEALAFEAREIVAGGHLDGYATSAVALAAGARAQLRHGRVDRARADLTTAYQLSRSLTETLPWFAAQTRLELARAYLTLRDRDGARALLSSVGQTFSLRPHLGVLARQADELRDEIDTMPAAAHGNVSGLTDAELRVLPLLTTHLSFREIGDRLFVSRNTIKTQAISIYRKLGVSSRSGAIDQAAQLGLIEGVPHVAPPDFIRSG